MQEGQGERIRGTEKHIADGKIDSCGAFVKWLNVFAVKANQRRRPKTLSAKFARSRIAVQTLFDWFPFQIIVGLILIVNFAIEIFKGQCQEFLVDADGHPSHLAAAFDLSDTVF